MKSVKVKVLLLLCLLTMCCSSIYAANWRLVAGSPAGPNCSMDMNTVERLSPDMATVWTRVTQPAESRVLFSHVMLNRKTGEYTLLKAIVYTTNGSLLNYANIEKPTPHKIADMKLMERVMQMLWPNS